MSPRHEGRDWEHHNADLFIRQYFQDLSTLVPRLPYSAINRIVSIFLEAFAEQRTIYVFGNGGSASSASHMMCDINKGASGLSAGTRPRVMALTDNASLISAWANDFGYERIFSEQLKTFIKPRDVAFAISTSGDYRLRSLQRNTSNSDDGLAREWASLADQFQSYDGIGIRFGGSGKNRADGDVVRGTCRGSAKLLQVMRGSADPHVFSDNRSRLGRI